MGANQGQIERGEPGRGLDPAQQHGGDGLGVGGGDDEPQVQAVLAFVVVVDLGLDADDGGDVVEPFRRHRQGGGVLYPAACGVTTAPMRLRTPFFFRRA